MGAVPLLEGMDQKGARPSLTTAEVPELWREAVRMDGRKEEVTNMTPAVVRLSPASVLFPHQQHGQRGGSLSLREGDLLV